MLTVDQYELIRRKHFKDGMSQRAIAQELGHSRKTVAKAIVNAIPPGYQLRQARAKPVIGPVQHLIDAWRQQDRHVRRKQRHTAQRIYERLRDDYDFKGHPATVRAYVASVKPPGGEVFMPLAFEPGEEAQVDWHEGWLIENGVEIKAQFFCMKLCYSKATFVCQYRRATLEAFLDGHVRAFAYFGGVPGRLAYDNLGSAVVRVGPGRERRLNERFKHLRSWYLFDTRFCNVARGNEKGDVENLAKRSERTYLVPTPDVGDLRELGPKLLVDCERDLDQAAPPPHDGRTRRELFEQEKRYLRPLPDQPFEACREVSTFVDKRSLVQYETNCYSAPVQWAYQAVVIKVFVERIELFCQHQQVAVHARCYDRQQYVLTPEHYLKLLAQKPGSLDNARPFKGQPWGPDFDLMRRELEYRSETHGTRQFIDILLLMTEYPPAEVKQAVKVCVRRRAFAYEAVWGALRNEPLRPRGQLDLSDRPELITVSDGTRPVATYDQLRDREEVLV